MSNTLTRTQALVKKLTREQVRLGHQKLLFLHLDSVGIPHPEPEFKFHPTRRWKIDFAWWFCYLDTKEEIKLALEVEGGIYSNQGGGHRGVGGYEEGLAKYNQLAIKGWVLIRILPEWLHERRNEARELLSQFFKERNIVYESS